MDCRWENKVGLRTMVGGCGQYGMLVMRVGESSFSELIYAYFGLNQVKRVPIFGAYLCLF
jgi:hypothetical protein